MPGFSHAPGGQLQQATDQWVGVKGARIILSDMGENVRAPFVAAWLRQLGHEAIVLTEGAGARAALAGAGLADAGKPAFNPKQIAVREVGLDEAASRLAAGAQMIDVRSSMAYRDGHIKGATWSIRPRIARDLANAAKPVVLVADDPAIAALAARDLTEAGCKDVTLLAGGYKAWAAAGRATEETPSSPSDADCVDFVFHTLGRNEGNLDAARAYLAWEVGLVDQLDADERATFRL